MASTPSAPRPDPHPIDGRHLLDRRTRRARRAPVTIRSTGLLRSIVRAALADSDAAPTVSIEIKVTPTSRADVVAAVRRGLRTALATASVAGMPPLSRRGSSRRKPADGPDQRRHDERRQRQDTQEGHRSRRRSRPSATRSAWRTAAACASAPSSQSERQTRAHPAWTAYRDREIGAQRGKRGDLAGATCRSDPCEPP